MKSIELRFAHPPEAGNIGIMEQWNDGILGTFTYCIWLRNNTVRSPIQMVDQTGSFGKCAQSLGLSHTRFGLPSLFSKFLLFIPVPEIF
jgi:hypothetical protein